MQAGGQLGLDELDPEFAPPPLLRVTPARLAAWTDCPRRYRLAYLDRPAPARGGPRAPHTLGAVVHLALRALFALPADRRTPGAAAGLVDRNWADDGFRDAAQAADHRERARSWVGDYAAEHGHTEPVALERRVSAATGRIVAEGRADRIDARDGELVVVDYKTGRRVPDPRDARDSRALALYALGAARTLHGRCLRVELHHLPTGTVAAWEHDAASLQRHVAAAEQDAVAAAGAAEALGAGGAADALFPARPAPRCGSCEVRRHCPDGRAAGPELAPWAGLAP